MTMKNRAASYLLWIVIILIFVFAAVYLISPKMMPYHERYLGVKQAELDARFSKFILYAMRIIGGCLLGIGFVMSVLVKNLYSGPVWIRGTILLLIIIVLGVVEYVMLSIGFYTPWWIVLIAMILALAGFVLSKPASGLNE